MDLEWLESKIDALFSWKRRFGSWVHEWHTYLSDRIDNLGDDMDDIAADVILIPSTVRNAVEDAKGDIINLVEEDLIKPLSYYVDALIINVRELIGGIYDDIAEMQNDLSTLFDFIGRIDDIIDARIEGAKRDLIVYIEDKFIMIVEHVLDQEVKR